MALQNEWGIPRFRQTDVPAESVGEMLHFVQHDVLVRVLAHSEACAWFLHKLSVRSLPHKMEHFIRSFHVAAAGEK